MHSLEMISMLQCNVHMSVLLGLNITTASCVVKGYFKDKIKAVDLWNQWCQWLTVSNNLLFEHFE